MVKIVQSLRAVVLLILLAAMPGLAHAQDSSTDSQVFVVTPLSFVKERDLDFGQIITDGTAGTVTMDAFGAITTTGGVTQVDGTQQSARFWGYGTFNQRVLINIDQNSYTLTRQGGTETMIMDTLFIGSVPPIVITTNPRRFRIANPDGYFAFTIVGRLQVGANQAPGTYEGEFTVTLEYV